MMKVRRVAAEFTVDGGVEGRWKEELGMKIRRRD